MIYIYIYYIKILFTLQLQLSEDRLPIHQRTLCNAKQPSFHLTYLELVMLLLKSKNNNHTNTDHITPYVAVQITFLSCGPRDYPNQHIVYENIYNINVLSFVCKIRVYLKCLVVITNYNYKFDISLTFYISLHCPALFLHYYLYHRF